MHMLVRRQMSGHGSTQITGPRVILDGISDKNVQATGVALDSESQALGIK